MCLLLVLEAAWAIDSNGREGWKGGVGFGMKGREVLGGEADGNLREREINRGVNIGEIS